MKKESQAQKEATAKQEVGARRESVVSFIIGAAVGIGAGALIAAARSRVAKKAKSPAKDFLNIEKSTQNLKSKLKKSFEELENQFHEFKEYVSEKEATKS